MRLLNVLIVEKSNTFYGYINQLIRPYNKYYAMLQGVLDCFTGHNITIVSNPIYDNYLSCYLGIIKQIIMVYPHCLRTQQLKINAYSSNDNHLFLSILVCNT